MSSSSPAAQSTLDPAYVHELVNLFSAIYWGPIVSICLFGITIVQAWTYYITNNDKWVLRLVVAFLVALDFLNVAIVSELVNRDLLGNYCNPFASLVNPRYVAFEAMSTYVIAFSVQLFFASRIYLFKKSMVNYLGVGLVICTTTASLVPGMITAIGNYRHPEVSYYSLKGTKILVILWAGFGTLCDISATVLLSWNLYHYKSNFKRTDSVVQRLVIYIVTRGFAVSTIQTANLITYLFNYDSLSWTAVHFCFSRVYVITMLAFLNSRSPMRQQLDDPTSDLIFHISGIATSANTGRSQIQFGFPMSSTEYSGETGTVKEADVTEIGMMDLN